MRAERRTRGLAAGVAALALAAGCAASPPLPGFAGMRAAWAQLVPPAPVEPPVLVETPAVEIPPPQGLRAVSGQLRIVPLRWEPVLEGEVAGYVVERAEGDGEFRRAGLALGRFTTSYVDGGSLEQSWGLSTPKPGALRDGVLYRYRVRPFDPRGRLAATPSDEVRATTAPPPEPPAELRAYSHLPRRIALTWHAPDDPSVRGYVLYRSPSQHGTFEPIARLEGRFHNHYVDRQLGDLRVFYYRVASVNAAGGEGAKSEPVRAMTKAEPLPPVGLEVVERRLGANRLSWEPNVEGDVTRYRVLRWREGEETPEVVREVPAERTVVWDEAVAAGERVTYRVVALDADGLKSDPSDPIAVESERYELAAEVRPGALELTWRERADEGFVAAHVQRSSLLRWRELGRVAEPPLVDREVEPGERYRYRVVLERGNGELAPPSEVLEVVVPEPAGR